MLGGTCLAQEATPAAGEEFSLPPFNDEEIDTVISDLAEAGIAVYEGTSAPLPIIPFGSSGPVSLLRSQVRAWLRGAKSRGSRVPHHVMEMDGMVSEACSAISWVPSLGMQSITRRYDNALHSDVVSIDFERRVVNLANRCRIDIHSQI